MNKPRWKGYKTFLGDLIERYVAHKRAIGRRFDVEHRTLRLLDQFAADRGIAFLGKIKPTFMEEFLASRPRESPRSFNHLLSTVRGMFDWLVARGYLRESPVTTRPKRGTSKRLPFIFEPDVVRRLLHAAEEVSRHRVPMRGVTYRAIFAILYSLGLRIGEACRLKVGDVDFARKLLVVRQTKFYKSRLVPFGPRVEKLLRDYIAAKNGAGSHTPAEAPLFSVLRGAQVSENTLRQVFYKIVPRLALPNAPGARQPRIHDLRHSFAVRTLLRWYQSGVDPLPRLQWLTTFMGHVSVVSTQTYLTITDEIFREANRRFESFANPIIRKELFR